MPSCLCPALLYPRISKSCPLQKTTCYLQNSCPGELHPDLWQRNSQPKGFACNFRWTKPQALGTFESRHHEGRQIYTELRNPLPFVPQASYSFIMCIDFLQRGGEKGSSVALCGLSAFCRGMNYDFTFQFCNSFCSVLIPSQIFLWTTSIKPLPTLLQIM